MRLGVSLFERVQLNAIALFCTFCRSVQQHLLTVRVLPMALQRDDSVTSLSHVVYSSRHYYTFTVVDNKLRQISNLQEAG